MTKKLEVYACLEQAGIAFEFQKFIPLRGGTCADYASVDFWISRPWGKVCLQIDEHEHLESDPSYDARRDVTILSSAGLGPDARVFILRYNPDEFKVGEDTCWVAPKERHDRLLEVLNAQEPPPCARTFFFYSKRSREDQLPAIAERWALLVRHWSRAL